jgi:hypothetical protein
MILVDHPGVHFGVCILHHCMWHGHLAAPGAARCGETGDHGLGGAREEEEEEGEVGREADCAQEREYSIEEIELGSGKYHI